MNAPTAIPAFAPPSSVPASASAAPAPANPGYGGFQAPPPPFAPPPAYAQPGYAQPQAQRNVSVAEALKLAGDHFQAGNRGDVEILCNKVLDVEPENPEALHLLGLLAHLAGKHGIALAFLEKAVRLNPASAQYHYNLGVVLGVLRRPQQALESYRQAVAIDPVYPNAMGNLGNVALECDYLDEALQAYEAVLARNPQDANIALARAIALFAARRFDSSGAAFEAAVALAPQSPRHHWEQAHHLLMMGEFGPGWDKYEARFAAGAQSNVWRYPYPFPLWQGEPLAGKTLLLHGEQGLGDEIMFGSIYPELIKEAAHVIICCQPHLVTLFRDSFPGVRVEAQLRADADAWTRRPADWLASAPAVDYQIPFGSLGRYRRRALADFPKHGGYLRADPAKTAQWAERLMGLTGLRVGLCWAANPAIEDPVAARRSRKKSLTLQHLEPLFSVPGIDFVSLQTWEAAKQVAAASEGARARIMDASNGLKEFADTAALIENLDLVITVDTSVAHLAGALNKPVWIALPWQADWRWRSGNAESEWYPSARLFRQPAMSDWETVIVQLQKELNAAQEKGKAPAAKAGKRAPA